MKRSNKRKEKHQIKKGRHIEYKELRYNEGRGDQPTHEVNIWESKFNDSICYRIGALSPNASLESFKSSAGISYPMSHDLLEECICNMDGIHGFLSLPSS